MLPRNYSAKLENRFFIRTHVFRDPVWIIVFLIMSVVYTTLGVYTIYTKGDVVSPVLYQTGLVLCVAVFVQVAQVTFIWNMPVALSYALYKYFLPWPVLVVVGIVAIWYVDTYVAMAGIVIYAVYFGIYCVNRRSTVTRTMMQHILSSTNSSPLLIFPFVLVNGGICLFSCHILLTNVPVPYVPNKYVQYFVVLYMVTTCLMSRFCLRLILTNMKSAEYLLQPPLTKLAAIKRCAFYNISQAACCAILLANLECALGLSQDPISSAFNLFMIHWTADVKIYWASLTHAAVFNSSWLEGAVQAYISPLLDNEFLMGLLPGAMSLISALSATLIFAHDSSTTRYWIAMACYLCIEPVFEPVRASTVSLLFCFAEDREAVIQHAPDMIMTCVKEPAIK